MRECPYCKSDDIALQESFPLRFVSQHYKFVQWTCEFFCRSCGQNFTIELDEDERTEYL